MRKKSKKYGTYYGELVNYKKLQDHDEFYYFGSKDIRKDTEKMYNCGVKEIVFDMDVYSDGSATMFFETDKNTDFKKLLLLITNNFRPDEFSEETPYHFRMWFD